ncbi:Glutamate-ammonia-ligase adenylyltransferase, partial [sediment metagenome]
TRARLCAGDADIGKRFEQIRSSVLQQARDPEALKQEVLAMRRKMLDTHTNTSGRFDIKNDSGGIIDVEFIVQYLVLAHAAAHPELTRNSGNLALLKAAAQAGLIPLELAEETRAAYREFRRLQHQSRLQAAAHARVDMEIAEPWAAAVRRLWEYVFAPIAAC